jgi:uncharacterized protein
MSAPEFSVATRDLDAAGKSLHFVIRASWVRGALEGTDVSAGNADGALDVRVSKTGNDVVVRGTLSGELIVPCARCLEPARVSVKEPLSALFVPSGALREASGSHGQEEEQTLGDADVVPYDGETVVLDGLVRDELLLALPIVPLCSESCAGIRREDSASGRASTPEASIDPRLMPLLSLKKRNVTK